MLTQTAKVVIRELQNNVGNNTIDLVLRDKRGNTTYSFAITKENIRVERKTEGQLAINFNVKDIQMLTLPDILTCLSITETSYVNGVKDKSRIFERHETFVRYEAQMFVRVFRIMRERVEFTMVQDNKHYDCYHIDGKVFFVEETEDEYKLMGTDLFELNKTHPDYRILHISRLGGNMDYRTFVDHQNQIADKLNKTFRKYTDGVVH